MPQHTRAGLDPVAEFAQKLAASLAEGTFVRLVLSPANLVAGAPEKVLGRCIDLKGKPHLSLTFRYATRDQVVNVPISASTGWVMERVGSEFGGALLCTTRKDWQLALVNGKRARLIQHPPSTTSTPARQHDQPHRSILDDSARDWLTGLGVTDPTGKVRPAMADKYSQMNRYLEIFSHLAKDAGWMEAAAAGEPAEAWTMADMGCGKGYLTFGLWHLCRRVWGWPVRVIGVEARPELVASTNRLAKAVGAQELEFVCGTIASAQVPKTQVLIALHACDVATDAAIRRGIDLRAQLILVAPCCHKELRPQLGHPDPLRPVLRHGIMEERMAEWATDGLRALFLEWAGYRTKLFEFVSSEHTPKNLMIAAVRQGTPFADPAARTRIQDLKKFFGVERHTLDSLLAQTGGER